MSNPRGNEVDLAYELLEKGESGQFQEILKNNPELISETAKDGLTLLHWAAYWGRHEDAELLLALGCSPVVRDKAGVSEPIYAAAQEGHLSIVRLLFERGADVNSTGVSGNTLLHVAARDGHLDVCKFLFVHGARIDDLCDSGSTPLHLSIMKGHEDIAVWLVQNGSDIDAKNENDATPLHYALLGEHFEIASKLITSGADFTISDCRGANSLDIAKSKELTGLLELMQGNGQHPYSMPDQNEIFGFMDPRRGLKKNYDLYMQSCLLAIKAFKETNICDLSSYAEDTLDDLVSILPKKQGSKIGKYRTRYLQSNQTIRLSDIQSYFLYAFTSELNKFSIGLLPKDELSELINDGFSRLTNNQILERDFPILGPQWFCDAVNREMPYLEEAFCDFQDEMILPVMKNSTSDVRLLPDILALVFIWSEAAGYYWFKEVVDQLAFEFGSPWNGRVEPVAMYQVKRSMLLIDKDSVGRVMELYEAFHP